MPLFECTECHALENTALCNYWTRAFDGLPPVCSACDPELKRWHGLFDKRETTDEDRGEPGFRHKAFDEGTPPPTPAELQAKQTEDVIAQFRRQVQPEETPLAKLRRLVSGGEKR